MHCILAWGRVVTVEVVRCILAGDRAGTVGVVRCTPAGGRYVLEVGSDQLKNEIKTHFDHFICLSVVYDSLENISLIWRL